MTNEELVKAYQDGDKEAMNDIVVNNKGLVNMVVNSFYNSLESSYLDRDDLEQVGYMGLMAAAKAYDPDLGFKFSSYASSSIKGHIRRSLRMTTPWEDRRDTSGPMAQVVSADSYLPGSESLTYLEIIEDPEAQNGYHDVIDQLDREILHRDLFGVMNTVFKVDDRPRNAVILRYGLTGRTHTFKEIAAVYGLSTERIRQMVNQGLKRIKRSRAGHELKERYKEEYMLESRSSQLSKLEYKNPVDYTLEKLELEKFYKEYSIV